GIAMLSLIRRWRRLSQLKPKSSSGRRAARPCFARPSLELLEDRTLLNAALATFVNSKLDTLRIGLATVVTTAANIPIINSPMSSIAGDAQSAFQSFQTAINPILQALDPNASEQTLQQQFYAAMDKSGFLRDLNGNGTTDDRVLTKNAATGD